MHRAKALGVAIGVATLALCAFVLAVVIATRRHPIPPNFAFRGMDVIVALAFGAVGFLVTRRRPGNSVGWLLSTTGLAFAIQAALWDYSGLALIAAPHLPGGRHTAWVASWFWLLTSTPAVTVLLLLFPDGRLPSKRWRAGLWSSVVGLILAAASFGVVGGKIDPWAVTSPVPSGVPSWLSSSLNASGLILLLAGALMGIAALVARFRRAGPVVRRQIGWLAYAGAFLVATIVIASITDAQAGQGVIDVVLGTLVGIGFVAVPVSIGTAILRYRLYDIDVVVSKTLVYLALSILIAGVYVAVVAGIGGAVGRRSGDLLLPVLATGLIAVGFGPVRERLQRVANRLVFGEAASPYEVVSAFGERVAAAPTEALFAEAVETIRRALRLQRVELRTAGRVVAAGPGAAGTPDAVHAVEDAELAAWGQLVRRTDRELLTDLAAQAGLAVRALRLREELAVRNEQLAGLAARLSESRARVGRAADEQRRRIERTIHDGPQQRLVALQVSLRLAEELLEDDPNGAEQILTQVGTELAAALDELRAIGRGIFPSVLTDAGLAAALEHLRRRADITIDVDGRYPADVEAAVYFAVTEAVRDGSHVVVERDGGGLLFAITGTDAPDGGRLAHIRDRIEALGGELHIERPGEALRILGSIPARELERVL